MPTFEDEQNARKKEKRRGGRVGGTGGEERRGEGEGRSGEKREGTGAGGKRLREAVLRGQSAGLTPPTPPEFQVKVG